MTLLCPWRPRECGSGQLNGATFAPNTTDSFFINTASIKCGDIDCGIPFTVPDSTITPDTLANDPRRVAGQRSTYDTDGSCAPAGVIPLPYRCEQPLCPQLSIGIPVAGFDRGRKDPFAAFAFKVNLFAPSAGNSHCQGRVGGRAVITAQSCTLPTTNSQPGLHVFGFALAGALRDAAYGMWRPATHRYGSTRKLALLPCPTRPSSIS